MRGDVRAWVGDGHDAEGRLVLVIDDEEIIREALEALLSAEGYRRHVGRDGRARASRRSAGGASTPCSSI